MVPAFLGHLLVTWISFLAVGLIARRMPWIIAAVVYNVAGWVDLIIIDESWRPIVAAGIAIVGIVHALIANQRWLSIMWARRERGESWLGARGASWWDAPRTARSTRRARAVDTTVPTAAPVLDVPRDAAELVADAERSAALAFAVEGPTEVLREPIDPQTASLEELMELPGIGRTRAQRLISRRRRQRIDGIDDLIEAWGLRPHEVVAIRDLLVFTAPPASSPGGRILDV